MKVRHYKRWILKQQRDEFHGYRKVSQIGKEEPEIIAPSFEEAKKMIDFKLYSFAILNRLTGEIVSSDAVFEIPSKAEEEAKKYIKKAGLKKTFPKGIVKRHCIIISIFKGPQEAEHFSNNIPLYSLAYDNISDYVYAPVYIDRNKRVIGTGDDFTGEFTYEIDTHIPVNASIVGMPYSVVEEMSK